MALGLHVARVDVKFLCDDVEVMAHLEIDALFRDFPYRYLLVSLYEFILISWTWATSLLVGSGDVGGSRLAGLVARCVLVSL